MITDADVDTLFATHQRRLWKVAYRFTRSRSAADDAVQTAFLRLWEARDRIAEPQYAGTWLYTTTLNWCRDEWRTSRREREATVPLLLTTDRPCAGNGPDIGVLVESALAGRIDAHILRRHYLEGETLTELATRYAMTRGAMKSRVHRAKRQQVDARQKTPHGSARLYL